MKYYNLFKNLLIAVMVSFLAWSCTTKTAEETDTKVTDSTALHNPAQEELNSDQSTLLQTILATTDNVTDQSVIRGISFGNPVSKVKSTETFELFEETADHIGYTKETAKLETIDVQYFYATDKKISKITIDVYLNSPDATKQLWDAGKNYFTENYEAPKEENGVLTWNKKSVRIHMEDVSKGKDYGLKFEFSPSGKTALAAK